MFLSRTGAGYICFLQPPNPSILHKPFEKGHLSGNARGRNAGIEINTSDRGKASIQSGKVDMERSQKTQKNPPKKKLKKIKNP